MSRQLAIAAALLRAHPRDFIVLTATCLVALPVGAAVLLVAEACLKG